MFEEQGKKEERNEKGITAELAICKILAESR